MSYYFAKRLDVPVDVAIERVIGALGREGFGVLSDIDVRAALERRLGVDIGAYRILGACHPPSAHRALQVENKIGTMLPCNIVVQELADGGVEVSAVDPVASMQAIANPALLEIAAEVRSKLATVISGL